MWKLRKPVRIGKRAERDPHRFEVVRLVVELVDPGRDIHLIDRDLNSDITQHLLLGGDPRTRVVVGQGDDVHVDHAARIPAHVAQDRARLIRIELVHVRPFGPLVPLVDHPRVDDLARAEIERRVQRLPIQGVQPRLVEPRIPDAILAEIESVANHRTVADPDDLELGVGNELAVHVGRRGAGVEERHVDLAAIHRDRRGIWRLHDVEHQLIDRRLAEMVVRIGLHLDELIGHVADEFERPGADRAGRKLWRLGQVGWFDAAQQVLGQDGERGGSLHRLDHEDAVGHLHVEANRVVVQDGDARALDWSCPRCSRQRP